MSNFAENQSYDTDTTTKSAQNSLPLFQSTLPLPEKITEKVKNCDYLELDNEQEYFQKVLDIEQNFEKMEQTDPDLISYVRARYIIKLPEKLTPYKLKDPNPSGHKSGFANWVRAFYKNKVKRT